MHIYICTYCCVYIYTYIYCFVEEHQCVSSKSTGASEETEPHRNGAWGNRRFHCWGPTEHREIDDFTAGGLGNR